MIGKHGGRIKGYNSWNQALFAWEWSQRNHNHPPDPRLLPYPLRDEGQVFHLPRNPRTSSRNVNCRISSRNTVSPMSSIIPLPSKSASTGQSRTNNNAAAGPSCLGPSRIQVATHHSNRGEQHFWIIIRGRQPGVYRNLYVFSHLNSSYNEYTLVRMLELPQAVTPGYRLSWQTQSPKPIGHS